MFMSSQHCLIVCLYCDEAVYMEGIKRILLLSEFIQRVASSQREANPRYVRFCLFRFCLFRFCSLRLSYIEETDKDSVSHNVRKEFLNPDQNV